MNNPDNNFSADPGPERLLLCSDLDRTILPNGPWPESSRARPLLRRLAREPRFKLAYVSGRDLVLLRAAIVEYEIPPPDYAIGDVGTTIYRVTDGNWQVLPAWQEEIAGDWRGKTSSDLAPLLVGVEGLRLQEPEKQNTCKLSFYTPARFPGGATERERLLAQVRERLAPADIRACLIWSIDEEKDCGLLDLLPERAGKLPAIRFLMRHLGFTPADTVFAGDSGNDLDVLGSELNAVLVANAPEEVRRQARELVRAAGREETLYCATGNFRGLNGNYSAGVIEGLVHYQPRIITWLDTA
ncbi:MAG TPA: HAD-IIB family hydrolase [Desulfurivibrio alkaliphilus]|uniref:HAD-IIB family hydrolase n=1 Tax=Desulfurivibrio alkaliphilus TaxID=427923 RepID=A0A7C2XRZ8_9BACT|nr:HAD-IIB family hydrolase [Desulfurivibrio alkaliphilus]